jgi:peptidoglycan endopeptidase LytF
MRGHATLARFAAPAAFLLAATIAVLLVRAALTDEGEATTPPAATTTAPTTTTSPGTTTTSAAGAEYYKIQAGDTLAVVAEQYDTTVEQLMTLNPDVDPVALTIGQRIRVK